MNKLFKHKILAGAMLFGFMLAGSSCEDEVGIKVTPETPFADKTLYEVIMDDPELTEFVEVINACGVECADSLFKQSRVYTVWAPVNGTFNKDSIIAETVADENGNSNRDIVFRSFVEAHIANHLVPANGTLDEDNTVLLLNNKNAVFAGNYKAGYTFAGVELKAKNIRVRNGILHKLSSPSEYKYSIWEYMKIAEGVDSVANYLYSYNVTKFNEGQSIPGPIVDGEQTFIDSVFVTSNNWLDPWGGVGNINSEDSTYIVYVPTNEMWENMVKKAEAHYNYDFSFTNLSQATKIERDSLRRYYARLHNLKYMTYSVNEQKHVQSSDSAMPAYRGGKRALFAKADLEKNVIFEKELSNGTFKVVDAMPYNQIDLWHDTIFLEGEHQSMWNYGTNQPAEVEVLTAYKSQINKDSMLLGAEVSGGAYFSYLKESGTATAKFKIPKVLSAKYHVAIVFVPKNITNEFVKKEDMYPCRLDIVMKQELGGEDADPIELYTAKYNSTASKDKALYSDPFKMDTLFFTTDGEKAIIEPRFCEFYEGEAKDYHITLEINTKTATNSEKRQGKNFDTSIRIDKIMLIPVLDSEE
jgi:hypothetical protein